MKNQIYAVSFIDMSGPRSDEKKKRTEVLILNMYLLILFLKGIKVSIQSLTIAHHSRVYSFSPAHLLSHPYHLQD